jgi:hypothetical protein
VFVVDSVPDLPRKMRVYIVEMLMMDIQDDDAAASCLEAIHRVNTVTGKGLLKVSKGISDTPLATPRTADMQKRAYMARTRLLPSYFRRHNTKYL